MWEVSSMLMVGLAMVDRGGVDAGIRVMSVRVLSSY